MSKKPKIRFKGFTDDWEQCKFSEITYPSGEKNQDNLPYESYSITNESGFVPQDEKFENGGTMRDADKRMYYIVSPQSFAYNPARINVGSIGYQNTSKNVIVSSLYEIFKTTEEVDDRFLWHWFKSDDFQKLIVQLQEGGVRLYFYYDKLCMGSIALPSLAEQQRIGAYLDKLDNLITLHQRKYEKLLKIKKSMLENMFPKNGEMKPKIRFKGFTDDWEQRKFSEGVSEIGDGLHGTPIYCEDGNVYFINGNNLVDGKIVISAETKKVNESQQSTADKSLDDTTILMSINGTIGNLAYYSGERLMLGKSAAYIKVSEFDKRFVYAYLQAPSVQGYFMDSLTGTTIKNLGLSAIREMIMFIPQDVDEQKRIGKFFDYLDHLITLHQRKLEKLKKLKKSMLENMFA